jgi:ascorbate-specific PTS system EIIC-type component UlaA
MDFLRFIVFDILGVTPLLVGFIALIGLLIQRKPIEKVLSGTFKTIVGFLVFAGGAGLAVTSRQFSDLIQRWLWSEGRDAAGGSADRTGANQIRHVRLADHGDWFWLEPVLCPRDAV